MQNSNADALSRIITLTKEGIESDELDPDMNIRILQEIHDLILSDYLVVFKTCKAIQRYYQ
jgi:hypothetical protein